MSCIHDELIQKYIDGETNHEEVKLVETHTAACNRCRLKIESQRRMANTIKGAINLLAMDSIDIPEFVTPLKKINKHLFTVKRISYMIAAASVLLFALVLTQKNKTKKQNGIIIETGYSIEVDANRPVTEFPLVINIIDTEGNISEYCLE
jgi:predicted anti-sigma-YlaC factor YlaD